MVFLLVSHIANFMYPTSALNLKLTLQNVAFTKNIHVVEDHENPLKYFRYQFLSRIFLENYITPLNTITLIKEWILLNGSSSWLLRKKEFTPYTLNLTDLCIFTFTICRKQQSVVKFQLLVLLL